MDLLYIIWNIEPEIFPDSGIPIRWYGLLFAMAFVSAYFIMRYIFKREKVAQKVLDDLTLYIGLGTIIGARLGHCFFYDPAYYIANPWQIFNIAAGGLASHGAAIGIIIAVLLFHRKHKINTIWLFDRLAIVIPLSGMFIRLGNLINSEIYGKYTEVPWAFVFERSYDIAHRTEPHHPTQIYEALAYLAIFILLFWLYRKDKLIKARGKMFGLFLILLFIARFFIEYLKEVQVEQELVMLQNIGMNLGQLLSIPFILLGVWFLLRKPKKDLTEKPASPTEP